MHTPLVPQQYPRLKTGVLLIPDFSSSDNNSKSEQNFFIGNIFGGLIFSNSDLLPILRIIQSADFGKSIEELATLGAISFTELSAVLSEIAEAGFLILDLTPPPAAREKGSELNQSHRYFQERIEPERALASWRKNQTKSVDEIFLERSEFTILIFGSNRVAITLLSLLYASGFTQIKTVEGHKSVLKNQLKKSFAKSISPSDVCGLVTRISDIGMKKPEFLLTIARNSNLRSQFNESNGLFPEIPHLIICTEVAQPDYIQRWMSEGIPHLQISQLSPAVVEIGPMITPGIGPCLRCVELKKFGGDKNLNKILFLSQLEPPSELPSLATALISGLLGLFITEFADTKRSALAAHSIRINFFDPASPEHIYWQPHEQCGCNWLAGVTDPY